MGTVWGSMVVRAMVVARWCLITARGKGLMTETLLANSASSYGADVLERVYGARGDALQAGMPWARPWEER